MVTFEVAVGFATEALSAVGAMPDEARRVAEALATAEQMGYTGHGLARLPGYVTQVRTGATRAGPWRLMHARGPIEHYDGCAGFGHIHLEDAAHRSAELARAHAGRTPERSGLLSSGATFRQVAWPSRALQLKIERAEPPCHVSQKVQRGVA